MTTQGLPEIVQGTGAGRPLARKPRRWLCPQHGCSGKNDPQKKTCATCGLRRRTTATGHRNTAKKLWAKLMKPGTPCFLCGGLVGVQRAHIIGRGQNRNPAVQWHHWNQMPLCKGPGSRGCHADFDEYRLDREALILRYLGVQAWTELQMAARERWDRDWPGVLARLREQLEEKV